jgi:hypothetical protein
MQIQDVEFNLGNSKSYELAVQFYRNGFAFIVFHTKEKKLMYASHQVFEESMDEEKIMNKFEEVMKKNEFIYAPFFACHVGLSAYTFTCVPTALFEEGTERKILTTVSEAQSTSSVENQKIEALDMNLLFECSLHTKLFFKRQFLRLHIIHSFSMLLQNWFNQIKLNQNANYLLQFEDGHFYLALSKDGKILCVNAFQHNTPEDFIYYILFVLETHKISNLEVNLVVYGDIDSNEKHHDLLKNYIKNISYGSVPSNLVISPSFEAMPVHLLGTLLHIASCAS